MKEQAVLPEAGFVRQVQLVGNKTTQGVCPFSASTLWRMVNSGGFPKPVKLGERITAWRVEEVRAWLNAQGKAA